jgi:hypothetical protein
MLAASHYIPIFLPFSTLGWCRKTTRVRETAAQQKLELKNCRRPVSLPRIDARVVARRRGKPNLELHISLAGNVRVCPRNVRGQ